MKIITATLGETLHIDGEIKIIVMDLRGAQARLGIDAPPEIRIDRDEVVSHKKRERRSPSRRLNHAHHPAAKE